MRLMCPDFRSECDFEDASIPVRDQELKCLHCKHTWCETVALRRAQGTGVRP